ncbi:hypothetical protein OIV83_000481 [Microbotryomycetes sp. JL201]|nr:hypothetical protein OIV83_000481 [Microbotryomycetes sp. JL201]
MHSDSVNPAGKAPFPEQTGDFKRVADIKLEFADVRLVKWISQKTGLKVVWADVEGVPPQQPQKVSDEPSVNHALILAGPLVQGYFSVITEIFDDSGRPHTLEHLIFMGSEQYPYKGVLDTVANRSFANGTNAWTDTTNTTYTIGTAGEEGFLSITPVYLDHVLYPTMTQAAFVTEVHNINGKGEDSGVVYSEMQGRENGSGDLMQLRLQRTLYSKKNALRSETGGMMEALRVLKVEEIRQYHASSYVPHNLTLIVIGRSLDPIKLLQTLESQTVPTIVAHKQDNGPHPSGWKRPFVESSTAEHPPRLPESLTETVQFPEKDESTGELMMSWIGVPANDYVTDLALDMMGYYLTESAVSPLYKEFVEIDEPSCTDISFYGSTENPTIITAYLSSVPAELLSTLPEQFKTALKRIVNDGIDMERMKSVLERKKLQLLDGIETDPADMLSTSILADVLFGAEDASDLEPSHMALSHYRELEGWTADKWAQLLNKYVADAPSVTIIGQPSAALADKLEREEKARISANKVRYGEEGLAKLAKEIEDAQAENDKEIPSQVISQFKVPDVKGIQWINVESARSRGVAYEDGMPANEVQEHVDADGVDLPLFVQFDHINSQFIEVSVVLFPDEATSQELRALLSIYLDSFFSLPITREDGTELSYEDVVRTLDAETLSYTIDINSPLQEGITLRIKVAKDKYTTAISWIRDLLYNSKFSVDRLKVSTSKAIQNLPSEKRDGADVSYATYRQMISGPVSTNVALNLLNRVEILPVLARRLKEEPQAVVGQFEEFRRGFVNPKSMRIQVKGNVLNLEQPAKAWTTHFKHVDKIEKRDLVPVKLSSTVLGPLGQQPSKKIVVFGLSSIESSFAYHVAKGPDSWTHPDMPALTVARAVLNAMEGFLWKFIRGAGLAYGASISQDVESGLIYYRVFKSPDSHKAFVAARDLLKQLVSGELKIDELTVESAKSSLAYNTAAKESTISDAAAASFNNMLFGLPQNHGRIALANTANVTVDDIQRVIKTWIAPMFEPDTSIGAVSSGLAKMEDIASRFEQLGYEVERRTFDQDDDGSSEEESGSEGSGSESE